jgi:hypothetical protein
MKHFGLKSLLVLAGAVLLCTAPAFADSYSNSDGFGSTYTLSTNCVGSLCDVTLTINSSGAQFSDISNVDFKLGSSDSLTGTLTAPTTGWTTITSSLNNSGCSGGNQDGQICSTAGGDFADTGGILTWTWTGVQTTGGTNIAHVGYKYDTSDTLGNGLIVSQDVTTVPEPSGLSLLAIGLVGLALTRKFILA